jgi:two-component system alkaline phosphatase synthesis response regulator PhoP
MGMKHEKQKILIVDDEEDILEIIRYNLQHAGYETETASNGVQAIEKARRFKPDLIMLDIMMPVKNGMETLSDLRRDPEFSETRVLFLTALGNEQSEIEGLNLGADDYIIKPIKPALLLSRIKAILRRVTPEANKLIEIGDVMIDREKFLVTYQGNEVVLAKKEFELLALLASKPGRVFLRHEILHQVWGTEVIVGDRTIDVHIRKIRKKTGDIITTVKGVGYRLDI